METGIHELTAAYALDALEAEERRAYEAHLSGCERCRAELASFHEVTHALAHAAAGPEPPARLRNRILAGARAEPQNVVPLRGRRPLPAVAAIAAAAVAAAIGLGVWAASLQSRLDDVRGQLAAQGGAAAVLADPEARSVALTGAEGRLVVSSAGRAALVISGLGRAPAGKTYEVWVIAGGAPQPAGLFDAAGGRTIVPVGQAVPAGAVVAVTVERDGGADAPTGAPLVSAKLL